MRKQSQLFFTAVLLPLDFLMLMGAGLAAYLLRVNPYVTERWPVYFHLNLPFNAYLLLIFGVSIFLLAVFGLIGLYAFKPRRFLLNDAPRIAVGVSAGIIVLVFYTFLRREWFDSRFLILAGWLLAVFFVLLGRFLMNRLQRWLARKYSIGLQRVLVVGRDSASQPLIENLRRQAHLGYFLVKHLPELNMLRIQKVIQEKNIEGIILADPDWPKSKLLRLVHFCENSQLAFKFVPNFFQTLTRNSTIENLEGIPMVEIKRNALGGWWRILKRGFDIVFALAFLLIFSPLFLAVALAVKLNSPGPILYRDYRYGYKKKKFVFYKFRSMKTALCDGELGTQAGNEMIRRFEENPKYNLRRGTVLHKVSTEFDPRITKVGRFIRKYSLDELPQFFNVLRGDMSIVGYRPHIKSEVEKYTEEQGRMFCAKPGLTGLAQISGRSDLDFDEEARLDLSYIENWSFGLDLIIILKTPFVMAYKK